MASPETFDMVLDTHVHFYQEANTALLLEQAEKNLQARAANPDEAICGLIWTRQLREPSLEEQLAGDELWQVDSPASAQAPGVWLRHSSGSRLFVFKGVQFVSEEGLEVLVAGVSESLDRLMTQWQGKSCENLIRHFGEKHLVILPWGVGKWLGARGQRVLDLASGPLNQQFFLGDNSGRPALWNPIKAFEQAQAQDRPVLPGSDPLPLPNQERWAGCSGIALEGVDDSLFQDSQALKHAIEKLSADTLVCFDRRESLIRFIVNQVKMRLP